MAITDLKVSEELMTSAPSIKYSGNEGPKSPQEEQMIMKQQMDEMDKIQNQEAGDEEMMMADSLLKEEYLKYVFEMEEQGLQPVSFKKFRDQILAEGQMSKGPILPSPEDPVNPFTPKPQGPVLPDRQMAAYGGIMGMDGRRQYGIGSFLKKTVRKLIPNEVADIAVKAAPFVAPFNPLLAAGMAGIGGFDKTGRIGSSLKSGLLTYGGGQLARGIGGGMGNLQTGLNPFSGYDKTAGLSRGLFTSPVSDQGGLGKIFSDKFSTSGGSLAEGVNEAELQKIVDAAADKNLSPVELISKQANEAFIKNTQAPSLDLLEKFTKYALDPKLLTGLAAGTLGATAIMGNMEPEEIQDLQRGEGLDVEAIRAEVIEAYNDPSGEKLKVLAAKYPFLSDRRNIDVDKLAYGGRIGRAEGGIMNLGGMEKDYRNTGGFVDIGEYEKKDDVPARLSVNEFVMTADAVRGMGDGDIDLGAKRMENLMGNMENKNGAQRMFNVSERLSEVV